VFSLCLAENHKCVARTLSFWSQCG